MHVFFVQYQHDPRTVKQVCYAADNMTHAIQLFNSEYCGLFEVVGCIYGWKLKQTQQYQQESARLFF